MAKKKIKSGATKNTITTRSKATLAKTTNKSPTSDIPETPNKTTTSPETITIPINTVPRSETLNSKPLPSPSTVSTRSKFVHEIELEQPTTEVKGISTVTPDSRKKKTVPKRGARTRKGITINEPTEYENREEALVELGKGKEKLVEEEDVCDESWDDVFDDTVTDINKKPRSLKRKRSTKDDSDDDDDDICNVSTTLCTSIYKDRVIEILKGLGLSETALQRCIQLCEHPILPGRYYPQHWLQSERAFSFFLEIFKAQG